MLGTEYKNVIYLLNCLFLVRSGDATPGGSGGICSVKKFETAVVSIKY